MRDVSFDERLAINLVACRDIVSGWLLQIYILVKTFIMERATIVLYEGIIIWVVAGRAQIWKINQFGSGHYLIYAE